MSSPGGSLGGKGGGWPLLLSCSPPQLVSSWMNPPLVTLTYHSHDCSIATSLDLSQPYHFLTTSLPLPYHFPAPSVHLPAPLCHHLAIPSPPPCLLLTRFPSVSTDATAQGCIVSNALFMCSSCTSCVSASCLHLHLALLSVMLSATNTSLVCMPLCVMHPIMQQPLFSMADYSCICGHAAYTTALSEMSLCHKPKSRQTHDASVKSEPVRGV